MPLARASAMLLHHSTSPTEVLAAARRNGRVTLFAQDGTVQVGHDQETHTYWVSRETRTARGFAHEVQKVLADLSSFL